MKKLRMKIEELEIDSFATSAAYPDKGTVNGYDTEAGSTCDVANTCGPQTCGNAYCILDTANANLCNGGGGTGNCGNPSNAPISCAGCTTYDYTNRGGDSCDYCLSFQSDSPQRCPCV